MTPPQRTQQHYNQIPEHSMFEIIVIATLQVRVKNKDIKIYNTKTSSRYYYMVAAKETNSRQTEI